MWGEVWESWVGGVGVVEVGVGGMGLRELKSGELGWGS